jgi:hypothetical protein
MVPWQSPPWLVAQKTFFLTAFAVDLQTNGGEVK